MARAPRGVSPQSAPPTSSLFSRSSPVRSTSVASTLKLRVVVVVHGPGSRVATSILSAMYWFGSASLATGAATQTSLSTYTRRSSPTYSTDHDSDCGGGNWLASQNSPLGRISQACVGVRVTS